ncbi:MAG: tyrosine-type recombinase/integrase [Limisphaerales bacterium]
MEIELLNLPPSADLKRTKLTNDQLSIAERIFAEIGDKCPLQAVRYFLENYREPVKAITLKAAYNEFYAFKSETQKRSPRTVQKIKSRVGSFAAKLPEVLVSDITLDQITGHIARGGAVNQNNNRDELRSFFNWCLKKGYCAKNPVLDTEAVQGVEAKEIAALTLADVRRLIDAALNYKVEQKTRTGKIVSQRSEASDGGLIPFLTIGLFAGLRPESEIRRLTWDDVNLEEKFIVVRAKAKTRTRRVVQISDNLVEWLAPFKLKRRPIFWSRLPKHFQRMRIQAGFRPAEKSNLPVSSEHKHLKPWVEDYMRHTAVSAHLAHHQSEDKTALWAGHAVEVLHSNYKGLTTVKDAAEYWEIRPQKAKIVKVRFKKAA